MASTTSAILAVGLALQASLGQAASGTAQDFKSRSLLSTAKTTTNIKLSVQDSLNKFNALDSSVNTGVTGVNTGKVTVSTFNDAQQNGNIGSGNTITNGGSGIVVIPLRRLSSTSTTTTSNIKLSVKDSLNKFNALDSSVNTGVTGVNTGKVTVTTFNDAQQNGNIGSGNTITNGGGLLIARRALSSTAKTTNNIKLSVQDSLNKFNALDSSVNTGVTGVNTGKVTVSTFNDAQQNANIGDGNTVTNGGGLVVLPLRRLSSTSTSTTSNIKLSVKDSLNKFNALDSSVNTGVTGVNTGKVTVTTFNDAQQNGNIGSGNTVTNGGSGLVVIPLRRLSSTSTTTTNNIKLSVKDSLNKFNALDSSVNTGVTGVNTGKVTVTTFNDAQQSGNIGSGNTVTNGGSGLVVLPLRRLSSTSTTTTSNIKLSVKDSLNKFNALDSSVNTGVTGVNTGKVTVTTFNSAQQNGNIGDYNTIVN